MRLRSVRKISPGCGERTVPTEETFNRARATARALGVTRLADITGLDRIGIPVHSAVVPKSDDGISIYNGKGVHPEDSRTGALMEAIERQTVLRSPKSTVEGSYETLRRDRAVPDPRAFNHKLRKSYREDRSYRWTEGYDLQAHEPVLVPADLAGYGRRYLGANSIYPMNSSNGLASGNCPEEVVSHALCEMIERDSWTFADLRSRWMPLARRLATMAEPAALDGMDDVTHFPLIDCSGAGEPIESLLAKFHSAGVHPVIRDITSELGICSVIASAATDDMPGFPQVHSGMGAHPNARVAVVRALTELAQSRAADIQAAREDIMPAGEEPHSPCNHLQRAHLIDRRRWHLNPIGPVRRFREMANLEHEDVADDIRWILSRLAGQGMDRVIFVDFTEPDGFSVGRVLVPGLEFWAMEKGPIGPRALAYWRRNVQ